MLFLAIGSAAVALFFLFLTVKFGKQIRAIRPGQFVAYLVVVVLFAGLSAFLFTVSSFAP